MVWSPIGYHLEIIDYDPDFWEGVETILENFYMNCLLPEIIDPRAPRGLPIREPDYIVEVSDCEKNNTIKHEYLYHFNRSKI